MNSLFAKSEYQIINRINTIGILILQKFKFKHFLFTIFTVIIKIMIIMKKTNHLGFQVLTKSECKTIVAGAEDNGGPKSGGTTSGGTVGNYECQLMNLNPPQPGSPEYDKYKQCPKP